MMPDDDLLRQYYTELERVAGVRLSRLSQTINRHSPDENMTSVYRTTKDFWFLKAGLIVVENSDGDFFVQMNDQDAVDCPIRFPQQMVISGDVVRRDRNHFELVKNFPNFRTYLAQKENFKNIFTL